MVPSRKHRIDLLRGPMAALHGARMLAYLLDKYSGHPALRAPCPSTARDDLFSISSRHRRADLSPIPPSRCMPTPPATPSATWPTMQTARSLRNVGTRYDIRFLAGGARTDLVFDRIPPDPLRIGAEAGTPRIRSNWMTRPCFGLYCIGLYFVCHGRPRYILFAAPGPEAPLGVGADAFRHRRVHRHACRPHRCTSSRSPGGHASRSLRLLRPDLRDRALRSRAGLFGRTVWCGRQSPSPFVHGPLRPNGSSHRQPGGSALFSAPRRAPPPSGGLRFPAPTPAHRLLARGTDALRPLDPPAAR